MRFLSILTGLLVLVLSGSAGAQTSTRTSVSSTELTSTYGATVSITAIVEYAGAPCPGGSLPRMPGTLILRRDGVQVQSRDFYLAFFRQCADGNYSAGGDFFLRDLEFGQHTFTVEYSGGGGEYTGSVSSPITLTVVPLVTGASPSGPVSVGLAGSAEWHCFGKQAQVQYPASVPSAPAGVQFPFGVVRYDLQQCFYQCGFLCPPGTPTQPRQNVLIEYPGALPASARLWQLQGSTWAPIAATVGADGRVRATVSGVDGSGEIHGVLALGIGDMVAQPPDVHVQDMWWAGEAENGWGMSVGQRDGRLFVVLYVYEDDGTPQWLVMPQPVWDPLQKGYRGDLYRPSGSAFTNYDTSRFAMGTPVGSARLAFQGSFSGSFHYTVDGRSGSKEIRRQIFAPSGSAVPGQYAGLWWGGQQKAGWGVYIGHQDNTLFVVWYTYDSQGQVMWYVMPGGRWTAEGRYSGTLFRTVGSPWVGSRYDPARLVVSPVGSMVLNFSGAQAASMEYTIDGVRGTETISPQPF